MEQIDQLLEIVKKAEAIDLHLASGSVPIIRLNGRLEKTRHRKLTDTDIKLPSNLFKTLDVSGPITVHDAIRVPTDPSQFYDSACPNKSERVTT